MIREGLRPPVLLFLQSKERARELFHELVYDGVRVDVLHAERTQEQRDAVVRRFRTGEVCARVIEARVGKGGVGGRSEREITSKTSHPLSTHR